MKFMSINLLDLRIHPKIMRIELSFTNLKEAIHVKEGWSSESYGLPFRECLKQNRESTEGYSRT